MTPAEHVRHVDTSRLELEGIERIPITAENAKSWTQSSETLRSLALDLQLDASRDGGVQPGEILWLAKRKKQAEVRTSSLVRRTRADKGASGRMDEAGPPTHALARPVGGCR